MAKQNTTIQNSISAPKKGMNRDAHESELTNTEYSFALNANIQDEHGNGSIVIQNEPSNIKCTGFKEGYVVLGHKYDINGDRTYFFLTNVSEGISEIGYISSFYDYDAVAQVESECACNITVVLENPLENTVQESICVYTTILSDFCELTGFPTGSFNFSIDHPIYESNIEIKDETTGKVIYFTDNFNPPRYIQLDYLEQYNNSLDPCTDTLSETCLNVDIMRIFKLFNKPCLTVVTSSDGANLRAGMCEVTLAYCSSKGDRLSACYSLTNPIAIHDRNNNILDQTNLDYKTNKSFTVEVSDLDDSYEFYKLYVIYHSGLDEAVSYYEYGMYPIDTTKVTIVSLEGKVRVDLDELLEPNVNIITSKGLTDADGYLIQSGLVEPREINLQPIANLLGGFARWTTIQAKEDLYMDGVNSSKYKSAMRDEVYPYSIKFFMDGGFETANFVLVPRPPREDELEEIDDLNTQSVLAYSPSCSTQDRDKRWQFENTATVEGICTIPEGTGIETIPEDREVAFSCIVADPMTPEIPTVVDTIATGILTYTSDLDLIDYINLNYTYFVDYVGTDPATLLIQGVLDDATDYPLDVCTPDVPDNCGNPLIPVNPTLGMFAIGFDGLTENTYPAVVADYSAIRAPQICNIIRIDVTTEEPQIDTAFKRYVGPREVYRRYNPTNITGADAKNVPTLSNPQTDSISFLTNKGATSLAGLQQTISAQVYGATFTNKLHTNAVWFSIDLGGQTTRIVEISETLCGLPDANTSNTVRVSFYTSAAGTTEVPAYSKQIVNTGAFVAATNFIELDLVDFPSGTAYMAIDSPVKAAPAAYAEILVTVEIGNEGKAKGDLTIIDASSTPFVYEIKHKEDDTASDSIAAFIEDYAATILTDTGVLISQNGASIILYYPYAMVVGNAPTLVDNPSVWTTGDIQGTVEVFELNQYVLSPPCGCFNVYKRDLEFTRDSTFTNLTFGKKMDFTTTCTYLIPILGNCETAPYEKGDFSYWESTETYPCNAELYDSSDLLIKPSDLSESDAALFEEYYTSAGAVDGSGNYILVAGTNFMNTPIRHYKYPDNKVSPFMSTVESSGGAFKKSLIYPIGFNLSSDTINAFLDVAVNSGLITLEERNKINKYEIFRGDRRINKSIIAKGLAFDMFSEIGKPENLYANYPLNSLGDDKFNGTKQDGWYNSTGNVNYSFQSPDTRHFKPSLPRELSIEGYMYGNSKNYFDTVENHPTYVILGKGSFILATGLAVAEASLEFLAKTGDWLVLGGTGGTSSFISIATAISYVALYAVGQVFKTGEYRLQWIKTLYDLGNPTNHAYYQASIGFYNTFEPNPISTSVLRGLSISHYLKEGMWEVADEYSGAAFQINNLDREESVFLSLKEQAYKLIYPATYIGYDNTYTNPAKASRLGYAGTGRSAEIVGNAASPYVALKQYSPAQYGDLHSINWISTGYCGNLLSVSDECAIVLGGDIFISRFAVKRKFPFFTTTAFGLAPLTPFAYSRYFNINPEDNPDTAASTRYYLNYKLIDEETDSVGIGSLIFPSQRSQFKLDYDLDNSSLYVNPEAKFYLFSYGFPYFLVESVINCNYRYAGFEIEENFYPNFGDIIRNTQEGNISMREPERFFYNTVYSTTKTRVNYRLLPNNYKRELWDKLATSPNRVIISKMDNSELTLSDPWLKYNALDSYTFPTSFGELTDIDSIESGIMLARFTNGITLFETGGNILSKISTQGSSFNKTNLGYAGSQHRAKVSCDFGHYWADAKRGKVFELAPGGKGLKDITQGVEKWFKENLPFKILRDFPTLDVDNAFKGIGLTMGWDDRLKRLFITKKDYKPLVDGIELVDGEFVVREKIIVDVKDGEYFEDCSWTIAYSPLTGSWISYYSFKPNYYIAYNNYFQTGINFSNDENEVGLWSHLPFLSSYQVFYGKLYPFTIEFASPTKYSQSVLTGIEYWLDVRKYYNKWDFTDVFGTGFNKAVVYNSFQNSGLLELVHQKNNDLSQQITYPKFNTDSITILQSELASKWNFNYIYNLIKNERAGLPIWINDCAQIDKTLDSRLLDYRNNYKDRLRGDYFLTRLTQDVESRFKMLFRFSIDTRNYYDQ